jgi:hypothetical protein
MNRLTKFLREAHSVAVEALMLVLFLIWAGQSIFEHLRVK